MYPTVRTTLAIAAGMLSLGFARVAAQPADLHIEGFAAGRFQANVATAEWLLHYDRCAWVSSDAVTALATPAEQRRLGTEWFCYEADGHWHAVYGRYDAADDRYDVVFHFRQANSGGPFKRTADSVPSSLALPFARALHAAKARVPAAVMATGALFNSYVRRGPGDGPEVWLLPAQQRNGWLIHGVELRYAFDSAGRTLRDSTVRVARLRGMAPDTSRSLSIPNNDEDVPTVGQTFFLLAYHRRFRDVTVYSRAVATRLDDSTGQIVWIHAARAAGAKP